MSVVNASQFSLMRARKELQKAFQEGDWRAVRQWDLRIGECLNQAFDDDSRDTKALIDELEKILSTYGKMVSSMPPAHAGDWLDNK